MFKYNFTLIFITFNLEIIYLIFRYVKLYNNNNSTYNVMILLLDTNKFHFYMLFYI